MRELTVTSESQHACLMTAILAYVIVFIPAYETFGAALSALSIIPVFMACFISGMSPAVAMSLTVSVINLFLLATMDKIGLIASFSQWPAVTGSLLVGGIAGFSGEFLGKYTFLSKHQNNHDNKRPLKVGKLRQNSELFEKLFENAPDGHFLSDLQGRLIDSNRATERLLGYCREELLGANLLKSGIIGPDQVYAAANLFNLNEGSTGSKSGDFSLKCKDGSRITVELSTTAIEVGDRKLVLGTARDVTAHKRLEKQLETLVAAKTAELHQANQLLKEEIQERIIAEKECQALNRDLERRVAERTSCLETANKELESFSFSVSHDLRSPLTSIVGFSNALLEDCGPQLNVRAHQYLTRIIAASDRMQGQIDALLNFSRMALSNLTISTVDLTGLAKEIRQGLIQGNTRTNVEMTIKEGLAVEADKQLLTAVMENLFGNAWKYTGKKEKTIIHFGAKEVDGETVYSITDNGAGFDMAYADKLFEPFQRLHRVDEFEGNGIGLMTVKRIIRHHGGRIWAEAAVEKGATFYFTIGQPEIREIAGQPH